jgi:ribonuclease HI
VFRLGVYLGRVTNNQAEYQGVILGARRARACGARRLDVVTDSELVVRQLEGRYRVKAPGLASLYLQALEELSGFEDWTVRHVRRELNAEADRMAGDAASLGREGRLPKGGEISGEGPAGGPAGPHDDP